MKVADNIGLVLEGGGFRGCYTAGALKWLYDNDIEMPYTAAISATAFYAFLYIAKRPDTMFDISADAVTDKDFIGLKPLFKEGGFVGYNYLFNKCVMPNYPHDLQTVRDSAQTGELGAFNMTTQQLEYTDMKDLDDKGKMLIAGCTLPITGRMSEVNGQKWLDGGIDTMVSMKRSKACGHDKNLVIVTKDKNYVRKENPWLLRVALKLVYHKYPKMLEILSGRVKAYYDQMGEVYDDEKAGKAILIRPTRDCGVKRFTGTKETLKNMFDLGYQDMEDRRDDIYQFLGLAGKKDEQPAGVKVTDLDPAHFKKPLDKKGLPRKIRPNKSHVSRPAKASGHKK